MIKSTKLRKYFVDESIEIIYFDYVFKTLGLIL